MATTKQALNAVGSVSALAVDDSLLCISNASLRKMTMKEFIAKTVSETGTPHYTLEKNSSPYFDVISSSAVDTYISQMGGYAFTDVDGKTYAAKLMDDDWNYYADGEKIADPSAVDTFIHVPTCYYKAGKQTMYFGGLTPVDGGHAFASPHWVGAYPIHISGTAARSSFDAAPTVGKTMTEFWTAAQARGGKYGLANYQFHCLVNALFQAKYGNLDSQTAIGKGGNTTAWQTWRDLACGSTVSLGDGSGECSTSIIGQKEVKLFGFEALWGKVREFRSGIRFYYDGEAQQRYAVIYDGNQVSNDASGRTIKVPLIGTAFPSMMMLGEYWDMIAAKGGGSSSTYYCDEWYDASAGEVFITGGNATYGASGGISSARTGNTFSDSYTDIGARLAYYGTPEIIAGKDMNKL